MEAENGELLFWVKNQLWESLCTALIWFSSIRLYWPCSFQYHPKMFWFPSSADINFHQLSPIKLKTYSFRFQGFERLTFFICCRFSPSTTRVWEGCQTRSLLQHILGLRKLFVINENVLIFSFFIFLRVSSR